MTPPLWRAGGCGDPGLAMNSQALASRRVADSFKRPGGATRISGVGIFTPRFLMLRPKVCRGSEIFDRLKRVQNFFGARRAFPKGVNARDAEIERDDRKSREHLFHKGLSSRPDPAGHCAMNPVKKLRCGDRREGDLRRPVLRDDAVPVEQTTLGRDQDAGIDQGRQGDFGRFG